jgi:Tol biopolymer transport system component
MLRAVFAMVAATPAFGDEAVATDLRGAYTVNGRIHVGLYGTPEGEPITTGPGDMKPSWSKTGDKIVFFRMKQYAADLSNWKNAICVVQSDGSNFRQLTDGTHGDFNPTWSRDGQGNIYFSRRDAATGRYVVHRTTADSKMGDEVPVSDPGRDTFSVSCLKDGRLFVTSWGRGVRGYCFLMTPDTAGNAKYEAVDFPHTLQGMADRISVSPNETKVCFDFQSGTGPNQYPGRTVYIADFDVAARTVSNPIAISDPHPNPKTMTLYPCWTDDESAVVYHCDKSGRNQLYMYRLSDKSTSRVSVNASAGYLFACGAATPK